MRVSLLFAVALAGCSGPSFPPASESADLATAPQPPGEDLGARFDLEGRIIGLDKQPLAGAAVSLCSPGPSCRDATTGTQGEFIFPSVAPTSYTLHARKSGATDYADLDFPLYLTSESYSRLVPLVLPRVGAGAAVASGPQRFAIDAALSLSLDGSALALPGPSGGSPGHLGGVRIPQELFPDFCVPSAKVLAMWAFAPTGISSSAPIGITLADSLGLAPSTRVSFIEVDPKDGRPAVVADGAVSADGKSIATTGTTGLHRLTWLLVVVLQGGP